MHETTYARAPQDAAACAALLPAPRDDHECYVGRYASAPRRSAGLARLAGRSAAHGWARHVWDESGHL